LMTRNIGFGLLLNGDTKHSAQKVVAAHDSAFLLLFSFALARCGRVSGHGGQTALNYGRSWAG
jgi:hypothetical protein